MKHSRKRSSVPRFSFDILVTAGPTREDIDPVRYISNTSSGMMGYSIAERFIDMGFSVCLVTGPSALTVPERVHAVRVYSAEEMFLAVKKRAFSCRAVVMSAAVCDLRPSKAATSKIKKKDTMSIALVKTPDIIKEIGEKPGLVKVGFALETEEPLRNGMKKLKSKKLDMIVVNTIKKGSDPFGDSKCDYVIIFKGGEKRPVISARKKKIAGIIAMETKKLIDAKNDAGTKKK